MPGEKDFARPPLRCGRGAIVGALLGVAACAPVEPETGDDSVARDLNFEATYTSTPITLTGRVVDAGGAPIAKARVTLIAWGSNAENDGKSAETGSDGAFSLPGLARRAALMRVAIAGRYTEIVPVDLQRPAAQSSLDIGAIDLVAKKTGTTRLIFGGDTMLARRYVDADGDGVLGEASDIIHPAAATADTQKIFRFVTDLLESDDFTVVNLETTVTDDPATPHPTKGYVLHSLPDAVDALPVAGVDAVSLGNNHVYDYLEAGMTDTLENVGASGLSWFGAGMSETLARKSVCRRDLNGTPFAFQGFNLITGVIYGGNSLHIVAEDTPSVKGGALALNTTNLNGFLDQESPSRFSIPVFHGGAEYVNSQPPNMRSLFKTAIQHGAGVVVAAHPHWPQGVSTYDAGDGPRFIFNSLGDFVFDQVQLETARSFLAMVDVTEGQKGPVVSRVRLFPTHLDGYVPRLLVGEGLNKLARFIGHLSTAEWGFGDGIAGATVFSDGKSIIVGTSASDFVTTDTLDARSVPLGSSSTGIVDFEPRDPSDSLARVKAASAATCEIGRDLLLLGNFEEQDVDDLANEGDRWDQSATHHLESSVVHSGVGAAVLLRNAANTTTSFMPFKNSITVKGGSKISLTGWVKGQNAGLFEVLVSEIDPSGVSISSGTRYKRAAGTYGWTRFTVDLTLSAKTTTVRLGFRGSPPASGDASTFVDDVALVAWDPVARTAGGTGFELAAPNDWSFLRCSASGSSLGLTLTHRAFRLP